MGVAYVQSFRTVFSQAGYVTVAVGVSLFAFSIAMWIPNMPLIVRSFETLPLADSMRILAALYGGLATNYDLFGAFVLITASVLFGMNTTLLLFLVRRRIFAARHVGVSGWGVVLGVLGAGCAACGSAALSALLATVGGTGVLAYLPFAGSEFGALGVLLLAYATVRLLGAAAVAPVCVPANNGEYSRVSDVGVS